MFFNCQTLGRRPGSGIVEVGFATFDNARVLEPKDVVMGEILIPVEHNLLEGLDTDPDTLRWWIEKQQGPRPSLKMPNRPHATMRQLLSELASQWDNLWYTQDIRTLWCKYPHFHIAILKAAYDHLAVERPLILREDNFRSWFCSATIMRGAVHMLPLYGEPVKQQGSAIISGGRAITEAKAGASALSYRMELFCQNKNKGREAFNLTLDLEMQRKRNEELSKELEKVRQNAKRRTKAPRRRR